MNNEEMEIDLQELWGIVAKRKIMIIILTLLAMAAATGFSIFVLEPVYESKSSIVIQKDGADLFYDKGYTNSDVMMHQKLVKTYVEILKSNKVMAKIGEVFPKYDKTALNNMITGAAKSDSLMFTIAVKSKVPKETSDIANSLAEIFIEEGKRYLPAAELRILDKAEMPKVPISPNVKMNVAISMVLGLMLSFGLAFLLEYLDTKIKGEEDMIKLLEVPVLATIPMNE